MNLIWHDPDLDDGVPIWRGAAWKARVVFVVQTWRRDLCGEKRGGALNRDEHDDGLGSKDGLGREICSFSSFPFPRPTTWHHFGIYLAVISHVVRRSSRNMFGLNHERGTFSVLVSHQPP